MAQNKIEYHIQSGAFFTFKVDAGATLFIGQPVKVVGDMTVALAGAGEEAVGVVYSGTVGIDGVNAGYKGANGDVVTVVLNKPIVYLTAGGAITAGSDVEVGAGGKFVTKATGVAVAKALSGAGADGDKFIAYLK
jgi:hypothetical protein